VCFARSVVIIGNEAALSPSGDSATSTMFGNVESGSDAISSDLYILLASLELDSVITMHIRHLKENNRTAKLPTVIQELYNDTNIVLLPRSCSSNANFDDDDVQSPKMADIADEVNEEEDNLASLNGQSGQRNIFISPALLQVRFTYWCIIGIYNVNNKLMSILMLILMLMLL
jgi:hypothetical protein